MRQIVRSGNSSVDGPPGTSLGVVSLPNENRNMHALKFTPIAMNMSTALECMGQSNLQNNKLQVSKATPV